MFKTVELFYGNLEATIIAETNSDGADCFLVCRRSRWRFESYLVMIGAIEYLLFRIKIH